MAADIWRAAFGGDGQHVIAAGARGDADIPLRTANAAAEQRITTANRGLEHIADAAARTATVTALPPLEGAA